MAPPSPPLGPTDGDAAKPRELSQYEKELIMGSYTCGGSTAEIARSLKIPRAIVQCTIATDPHRLDGVSRVSQPRSVRRGAWDARTLRLVHRHLLLHPRSTHDEIIRDYGLDVSITTLKAVIKETMLLRRRPKPRAKLMPDA